MKKQINIIILIIILIWLNAFSVAAQCTSTLSPDGADNQTVCINTPIESIIYSTTDITDASVTGLPDGVTGVWASPNFTISGTPTVSGNFSYTVTFTGEGDCSATGTISVTALPVTAGTITGQASVCPDQKSVNYEVSEITGATEYIWSFSGDGATINGETNSVLIDFTDATAGNLTVKGKNMCGVGVTSPEFAISLKALPGAAGTITGDASVCPDQKDVSYQIPTIPGATEYVWSFTGSGATFSGNTNPVTVDFTSAATGELTVAGKNTCGEGALSAAFTITVNPLPGAAGSVSGSATVCQGQADVSYSVDAITNASIYEWSYSGNGAHLSVTDNTVTITFDSGATSGTLTVRGRNACGYGTSSSLSVTVNPLPSGTGVISGPEIICQGAQNVTYTVSGINNVSSYHWNYTGTGATYSSTTNSVTIDFASNATSGNLTVYGINGCDDGATFTFPVTINPIPTLSGVSMSPVCDGSAGVIQLTGLLSNSSFTITYGFPGHTGQTVDITTGSGITQQSFTTVPLDADDDNGRTLTINSITITSSSPSCTKSFSNTVTLQVGELPRLSSVSQKNSVCSGSHAVFAVSGLIGGTTSTIYYTVDGGPEQSVEGIVANGSGKAEFTSVALSAANNGKRLYVTRIVRTSPLPVCENTISDVYSVMEVAGVTPTITGLTSVCQGVPENYSTNISSPATYDWNIISGTATINSGESSKTANVTWTTPGVIEIICTKGGCTGSTTISVSVNTVDPPLITGDLTVYPGVPVSYSTTTSGKSSYQWSVTGGTPVTASNGSSITVEWNSETNHSVSLSYVSSNGCQSSVKSETVYVRPSVSNVHIDYPDGDPAIGKRFTVVYTYKDGNTGADNSEYKWRRDGVVISNAREYIAVPDDFNKVLTCEVIPKSSVGDLTGTSAIATSSPVEDLREPLKLPVAENVCIDGIGKIGETLTGKYYYNFYKAEGLSTYRWIRVDTETLAEEIAGTGLTHIVTLDDINPQKEIYFEVIPVSTNKTPLSGLPVRSGPMAKIEGLKDQYGIAEEPVKIEANVDGGFFTGNGLTITPTEVTFTPANAGSGDHVISYYNTITFSTHSCSQIAPHELTVDANIPIFSEMEDVYCYNATPFTVYVSNILYDAEDADNDFILEGPYGVYDDAVTVQFFDHGNTNPTRTDHITINPAGLVGGTHKLTYTYMVQYGTRIIVLPPPIYGTIIVPLYKTYSNYQVFELDYISQDIRFINLDDKYCKNADPVYISVEGINPEIGTPHWTGPFLSDHRTNSVVFKPSDGVDNNTYLISYIYESPRHCFSPVLNKSVTIKPMPDSRFSLEPSFNIEAPAFVLVPDEDPGTAAFNFSGRGVSGNSFIPSLAAVDLDLPASVTVTYKITDANGCTSESTKATELRSAKGTITGINPIVCYDNVSLVIKASGVPVNGVDGAVVYKGFKNLKNTIVNTGSTTASYSVPAAGEGDDRIDFSYEWDGVSYTISKNIEIDRLGEVEIYNLDQDQIICKDAAPFALEVSTTGGFFTGPVDEDGFFIPSKGKAPDMVKYTYINPKTNCSIDTTYHIYVYDPPSVDFAPDDVCINDDADATKFKNLTASTDPVVEWEWKFYDEGGKTTLSSQREAEYLYLRGGLQKVTLKATTDKGCIVEREKTFDIARRPVADFFWTKDCFHHGEVLELYDASTFTTLPKQWSWKINGVPSGNANNTTYLKTDTGFLRVEYIVKTDYLNCHDTIIKDVYIRPSITIGADGYFEDFESGKSGWLIGDKSTIWSFGTPAGSKIQEAASGQKAWYTAFAGDGSSSVESPCFDFSGMDRPLLKLKLRRDLDKDRDGAALQYKVGDDPDWKILGTIDDGIDWYNSAIISGRPGGSPVGWTTAGSSDNHYYDAIHTLDDLKGKKDVKFRMAYGAAGVFSEHDGLAFDDVFIGERSRHVLVEHFMSYNNNESMLYKALVDSIAEHKEGDVINIQYHTNLSGIDSLYMLNPGEINARILFYGLTRVPYTFVDGGTGSAIDKTFNMLYDYRSNPVDSNEITKRTLVNSPFNLYIDPVISGRVLSVRGYIKAIENIRAENLTLFIAVTEKQAKVDYTGAPTGMKFLNVFRKFIPDASGTTLKSNWGAGDSIAIPEKAWTIDKGLNSSDIEIIAFLQSAGSKDVYQSFSVVKPEISVNIENPPGREGRFSVYPNPASEMFTISFEGPLKSDATIRIYNFSGEIVREYKAGAGTNEFTVDHPGLKGGIYLVRISYGSYNMGFRKLIITED